MCANQGRLTLLSWCYDKPTLEHANMDGLGMQQFLWYASPLPLASGQVGIWSTSLRICSNLVDWTNIPTMGGHLWNMTHYIYIILVRFRRIRSWSRSFTFSTPICSRCCPRSCAPWLNHTYYFFDVWFHGNFQAWHGSGAIWRFTVWFCLACLADLLK